MSLRNKLLLCFILTALVPAVIAGVSSYYQFKQVQENAFLKDVTMLADLKVIEINNFFAERQKDLRVIQKSHRISSKFAKLIAMKEGGDTGEFKAVYSGLNNEFGAVIGVHSYIDLMLVDMHGKIIFVGNKEHKHSDIGRLLPDPGNSAFGNGLNGMYISEPFRNSREEGVPSILITAPLFGAGEVLLGVVALEMKVSDIYAPGYQITKTDSEIEILLIRMSGEGIRHVSPTQFDVELPAATYDLRSGKEIDTVAGKVMRGVDGQGVAYDQNGVEAIAAWRYLPEIGWGVVVKVGAGEVFHVIKEYRDSHVLLLIVILLVGGLGFVAISKSITNPIEQIQSSIEDIKNIDQLHEIKIDTSTEVAPLVRLFNQMMFEIKHRATDLCDFKKAVNAATIVGTIDQRGVYTCVNERLCKVSKYSRDELIGRDFRTVNSFESVQELYEMSRKIKGGRVWRGELKNVTKDGKHYWVDTTIVPCLGDDKKPQKYLVIQILVTKQKKAEAEIFRMAHYDELTGLPNRAYFKERFKDALDLNRSRDKRFSVMVIDLDGFKKVNDTYGHDIGDKLLQTVSQRMRQCVGPDNVYRLGGDEFTVLLPDIFENERVYTFAGMLVKALKEPFIINGVHVEISCSIGVSFFPDHGECQEDLLRCADKTMYRAKKSGKNKFLIAGNLYIAEGVSTG